MIIIHNALKKAHYHRQPQPQTQYTPTLTFIPQSLIHPHHAVNRTLTGVALEPIPNTLPMESTQTLKTRHPDTNLEFLKTNRALRLIHTVLLRGRVRKHASKAVRATGAGCPTAQYNSGVSTFTGRCAGLWSIKYFERWSRCRSGGGGEGR